MTAGGVVRVAVRAAAGIAAVACLFAGLWIVFSRVTVGLGLIGLGIVLGIVFGRVPAGTGDAG
jgi:uncharacterized RDD family membrane protein YckC